MRNANRFNNMNNSYILLEEKMMNTSQRKTQRYKETERVVSGSKL